MAIPERAEKNGDRKAAREAIRRMFARIAPRYDLLNRLLSAGMDQRWREAVVKDALTGAAWRPGGPGGRDGDVRRAGPPEGIPRGRGPDSPNGPILVLDTCAGTGDLALAFARALGGEGRVWACDYTPEMLRILARKLRRERHGAAARIVAGDSLRLPFGESRFHVVSAAFGIRNVAHGARDGVRAGLVSGLEEMRRVLRPGGRAVILEFSTPAGSPAGSLVRFYFRRLLPFFGNAISRSGETAYRYLPESVDGFPDGEEFLSAVEEAGLQPILHRSALMGLVSTYIAQKACEAPDTTPPGPAARGGVAGGATRGAR